ncbi:MAG: ABC transporter permease [Planctomycetales bacterium]|nr:ABC transporter permease [Planctomycetales bacterium]
MSLWKIAWRSIQQRRLSSLLTGFSMALGVALVILVLVIYGVVDDRFHEGGEGYHLIVGAKGGKLQLVLNTVFHLSQPIENVPYSVYKEFTAGKFASSTELAVPCCMGDSYQAGGQTFRVVGTTPDMFDKLPAGYTEKGEPRPYRFQSGGRNFKHENFFEAVIGSVVANVSGLKVGDSFQPAHGIVEEGEDPHVHDDFKIVGILEPSGTPNDRALFVNMEGFYLLEDHSKPASKSTPQTDHADEHAHDAHDHDAAHAHDETHDHEHAPPAQSNEEPQERDGAPPEPAAAIGVTDSVETTQQPARDEHGHDEHGHDDHAHGEHDHGAHAHDHHGHDHHAHHEPLPESQREVTAILVVASNTMGMESLLAQQMFTMINEGQEAQAVFPTKEVHDLFATVVGPVQLILLILSMLIVVVAGIGIMVSIYNTMSERGHEIAVMRALGAGRGTVMAIVLFESILLSLAGGLAGVLLGHAMIGLASPYVVNQTGVTLHMFQFDWKELALIPGLVALATLVGFIPALAAYRTDVSKSLTARP